MGQAFSPVAVPIGLDCGDAARLGDRSGGEQNSGEFPVSPATMYVVFNRQFTREPKKSPNIYIHHIYSSPNYSYGTFLM
jgi:hypothetical protein